MPLKQKEISISTNPEPLITVLSIDGGGVRGIIPATILVHLEHILQTRYDKEARIVDYFDVIAGTSAGSIVAAMLSTPTDHKTPDIKSSRPRSASTIVEFFKKESPHIFPNYKNYVPESQGMLQTLYNKFVEYTIHPFFKQAFHTYGMADGALMSFLAKPRFKRSQVDKAAKDAFPDFTIDKTLKNVIIPAYRIDKLGVHIFSTERAKSHPEEHKIQISDAVLSSTAAPVKFDPYEFKVGDPFMRFADGGLAVNNPTLLALCDATRLFNKQLNSDNYLVLSLGTGTVKKPELPRESSRSCFGLLPGMGGIIYWFFKFVRGMPLIVHVLLDSVTDMVDYYMSQIFDKNKGNYLRIQDYHLSPDLDAIDESENIEQLEEVANALLKKNVSRINPLTGNVETQKDWPVYEDLLSDFANELHKQRQKKLKIQA